MALVMLSMTEEKAMAPGLPVVSAFNDPGIRSTTHSGGSSFLSSLSPT